MKALNWVMLLVCLGTSLGYGQGNDPDAESKIIALERVAKLQAYEAKDLKTLDAMLDDAFVYVDSKGRLRNKAEILAYVQATTSLQFIVKAMLVRMHGDTAVVTGLYRMKAVERGKPFDQQGRFVDTWLYKNGRWVGIASLLTPSSN